MVSITDKRYFLIDFDGTFTRVEAIEELSKISLREEKNREETIKEISEITKQGMDGKIPFNESLNMRFKLLKANKKHINELIEILKKKISPSFLRNKDFFTKFSKEVFIFSGGFKEYIIPIVEEFGILPENVYANSLKFDEEGNVIGFDENNLMCKEDGKTLQLQELGLAETGDVYVIGDGYTDYQMKESGLVKKFFLFTENFEREVIASKADHVIPSFDEFLYYNKLPMSISYPKSRIKVLLLENIHEKARLAFEREGYQVETMKGALSEEELCEKIVDVSVIGIRSKTKLTKKVLSHAKRLIAVGAFCIGTNQIDLLECARKGIVVFNAPYSNTRSVVELAIGEIIMLRRKIFDKSVKMHKGEWNKSAEGSYEIRGKKLGIVGYGNIGSQLSVLAEDMGMDVYYYDSVEKLALGNATKCWSMKELFGKCDIITVHVDGRDENKMLIGEEEFSNMKEGAIFINLSRGFVVDVPALSKYIKNRRITGAAIDVFPTEPKNNEEEFLSELRGLPNVILTPHIGGSTLEAQENIAHFVPMEVIDFVNTGKTTLSVNFPNLALPPLKDAYRFIHIHENVPGVLANINSVLANNNMNIIGQYLKTNEEIGYVITDVSRKYDKKVIEELKKIPNTIKFRILY